MPVIQPLEVNNLRQANQGQGRFTRGGSASSQARAAASATPPASRPGSGASIEPKTTRVEGRVIRVLFSDEASGKAMVLVRTNAGKTVKLQGMAATSIEVGRAVSADALLETHPRWGEQYKADIIDEMLPLHRSGVIAYMASHIEGVGEKLASAIFDRFGTGAYDVLDKDPSRLLSVPGITRTKLPKIVSSWGERTVLRSLVTHLAQFEGLGPTLASRVYNVFGERSMEVIRQTPYELARVPGVGFLTADKIATGSGVQPEATARIVGAVMHVFEARSQQGHTACPKREFLVEVSKLLGFDQRRQLNRVDEVVAALIERRDLADRQIDGDSALSMRSTERLEQAISHRIGELTEAAACDDRLDDQAAQAASHLGDEEQAKAVANAFRNPISVITGGPGCGKTTVTKVIGAVAAKAGLKVVMCAPTGKAARRTTEATGYPSQTVHSLLGYRMNESTGVLAPSRNRDEPLEGDLFILDEGSMMDLAITKVFLDAVPDGARLVIVGDADQLPSVGAGNVLHDIIDSDAVAVTKLKTVHRTALQSDIVSNAHKVIAGRAGEIDLKGGRDFQMTPVDDEQATVSAVVNQYLELVARHGIENVQVLSSRRETAVGVYALNDALRAEVNPLSDSKPSIKAGFRTLQLGDRVIRTSNNRQLGVSNGEVGIISDVDVEAKSVTVNFGDRSVVHGRGELQALELAYAITAHKSQGSEYAGVVIATPRAHKFMLNRNLLYTAITRGKKDVRLVGAPDAVRAAATRAGGSRCTGLSHELRTAFDLGPKVRKVSDADAEPSVESASRVRTQPMARTQTSHPVESAAPVVDIKRRRLMRP